MRNNRSKQKNRDALASRNYGEAAPDEQCMAMAPLKLPPDLVALPPSQPPAPQPAATPLPELTYLAPKLSWAAMVNQQLWRLPPWFVGIILLLGGVGIAWGIGLSKLLALLH